eukprot:354629-Chlamydomonas_euryale.AAC.3
MDQTGSYPTSPTARQPPSRMPCVRFVPLFVHFPALVPSIPFCTWRSLRWGMSGLTPSDPFGWRRLSCPELNITYTHGWRAQRVHQSP